MCSNKDPVRPKIQINKWKRIYSSGAVRWQGCTAQAVGRGCRPSCVCSSISTCSPTWKLSKPCLSGFLWRLHYIGVIEEITGHWQWIQPPVPYPVGFLGNQPPSLGAAPKSPLITQEIPRVLGVLYREEGFPGNSEDKESACNAGDSGLIPEWGRSPGEGKGYNPWACKKSDMTERLTLSLYFARKEMKTKYIIVIINDMSHYAFLLSCTHVSLLQVWWRGDSSVVILLRVHRVEIRFRVLLVGDPNPTALSHHQEIHRSSRRFRPLALRWLMSTDVGGRCSESSSSEFPLSKTTS